MSSHAESGDGVEGIPADRDRTPAEPGSSDRDLSDIGQAARGARSPEHGRLELPRGFRSFVTAAGLREQGSDVSVLAISPGAGHASSAAVFTQSLFAGASVVISREIAGRGDARAMVTVAKNANVATGEVGLENARELRELAARVAGVEPEQVLVASTGVIGRRYPMDLLRTAFAGMGDGAGGADAWAIAEAMMTTDTHPKTAEAPVPGSDARIVGIAKGVGMVEPNMATMIAVICTDALVPAETLDSGFRSVVDRTFNALSVDTDTSTSDTAVILASGEAGEVDREAFEEALGAVCLDLTKQLARDGEGASKLLTVSVTGARDDEQAKRVAKAVLNSPLVKTAVHGADPNWGRVAMAIGKLGRAGGPDQDIDPEKVRIVFGDLETYPRFAGEAELAELTRIMAAETVEIGVELGVADGPGAGAATVYGCDLTREYIAINADYTT